MATLKPGIRLKSAVCDTEIMIVKGSAEQDLCCGGVPLQEIGASIDAKQQLAPGFETGTLMGKRYVNEDGSLEALCTKPGTGGLSLGASTDKLLQIKQTEALPSSD